MNDEIVVFHEVGNTILKHLQKKDKDGTEYMKQLSFLNIEYNSLGKTLARETVRIAKTNEIVLWHCSHSLVSETQISFGTEDKKLLRKFKNTILMEDALERIEKESRTINNHIDKNSQ